MFWTVQEGTKNLKGSQAEHENIPQKRLLLGLEPPCCEATLLSTAPPFCCFWLVVFVFVNPLSDLCDIRGPLCLCSDCTEQSIDKNSVEKLGSATDNLKTDNILAIGPKLVHPSFCSEIRSHKAN